MKIVELNKEYIIDYLDSMFKIKYDNMSFIRPSDNNRADDYVKWHHDMLDFAKLEGIHFILALENNDIVGYFIYVVSDNTIKLSDIQIIRSHQGYRLTIKKLLPVLKKEIGNKEVYAIIDRNNLKMQTILYKLGFLKYEETKDKYKYRTNLVDLKTKIDNYSV